MVMRIILSLFLILGIGYIDLGMNVISTLSLGQLAGTQFDNSNISYLNYTMSSHVLHQISPAVNIVGIILLLLLWTKPLKMLFEKLAIFTIICGVIALPNTKAFAFASTTDVTEIQTILPNESAFWIPDVGANKDSQTNFDSEEYLRSAKVAMKRFEIPHQKLAGTGGKSWTSGWDLYVPTGRLIIVPRAPFSHEWVDAPDRGTSNKKQGILCQTKEGLDYGIGVTVSASVTEDQAPKFLYNFGVRQDVGPDGRSIVDRTKPEVIFQSVYYARSLGEVMEDNGRHRIQTLFCDKIMRNTLDYNNEHLSDITKQVADEASKYFMSVGITMGFFGLADTVNFDKEVQDSINRKYIAQNDAAAAQALSPYITTLLTLANVDAVRHFGEKSDGHLPNTVVGAPPSLIDMFAAFNTTGLGIRPVNTPSIPQK